MSFCFLYNVVLENYSVQNFPWGGGGEGGLLPAQGFCEQKFRTAAEAKGEGLDPVKHVNPPPPPPQ